MSYPSRSNVTAHLPSLGDPQELNDLFNPGRWLDRRQLSVRSCTVISGTYERPSSVAGGFRAEDVHFFDYRLTSRTPDSWGQIVDCFREPEPLGDILFVPAGQRYLGGGGVSRKQRTLYVFLKSDPCELEDIQVTGSYGVSHMRDFMDLRNERIRFLLSQLARELYEPGLASALMVEGLATTLMVETARMLHQQRDLSALSKGGLAPITLRKIKERVMDEGLPPSLTELSELCNLSRRHLMRGFKESTGKTVGQFIQQAVLDKARFLLQKTDKPISNISRELAFATVSSFSTAFRRATGESPSEFRKRTSGYDLDLMNPR